MESSSSVHRLLARMRGKHGKTEGASRGELTSPLVSSPPSAHKQRERLSLPIPQEVHPMEQTPLFSIDAPVATVAVLCGQVRPRRFGYRLRCCLPHGHEGEHRWTPELMP
jgi:hypothetical protein